MKNTMFNAAYGIVKLMFIVFSIWNVLDVLNVGTVMRLGYFSVNILWGIVAMVFTVMFGFKHMDSILKYLG